MTKTTAPNPQRPLATRVWQELLDQLKPGAAIAVAHVEDLKVCVCTDDRCFLWMVAFEGEPPLSAGSSPEMEAACGDAARMLTDILGRYPMLGQGRAA